MSSIFPLRSQAGLLPGFDVPEFGPLLLDVDVVLVVLVLSCSTVLLLCRGGLRLVEGASLLLAPVPLVLLVLVRTELLCEVVAPVPGLPAPAMFIIDLLFDLIKFDWPVPLAVPSPAVFAFLASNPDSRSMDPPPLFVLDKLPGGCNLELFVGSFDAILEVLDLPPEQTNVGAKRARNLSSGLFNNLLNVGTWSSRMGTTN